MTKKELIKRLLPWPEDAEVEIELKHVLDTGEHEELEAIWADIIAVDDWDSVKDNCIGHCLIVAGNIVMG